jgi:hypothetical protein
MFLLNAHILHRAHQKSDHFVIVCFVQPLVPESIVLYPQHVHKVKIIGGLGKKQVPEHAMHRIVKK